MSVYILQVRRHFSLALLTKFFRILNALRELSFILKLTLIFCYCLWIWNSLLEREKGLCWGDESTLYVNSKAIFEIPSSILG